MCTCAIDPVGWNPRYLAYCVLAHGQDNPDAQLKADEETFPGGKMCGFMLWIGDQWRRWDQQRGQGRDHVRLVEEHIEFNAWLDARVAAVRAGRV